MYQFKRYEDRLTSSEYPTVTALAAGYSHRKLDSKGRLALIEPEAVSHLPGIKEFCYYEWTGDPIGEEGPEDER